MADDYSLLRTTDELERTGDGDDDDAELLDGKLPPRSTTPPRRRRGAAGARRPRARSRRVRRGRRRPALRLLARLHEPALLMMEGDVFDDLDCGDDDDASAVVGARTHYDY